MKSFIKGLFNYNHHFNQELCRLFEENQEKVSEKAEKLFNHILNAHQIWNNRIENTQTPFDVWEIHSAKDLYLIDKTNYEMSLSLPGKFDLNQAISYTTSKGQNFTNSIGDILFHIINHSTYHRGQIATELKQNGIMPLASDYIFYKR